MVDVTADVKTRLESIPGYEPGKPAHPHGRCDVHGRA